MTIAFIRPALLDVFCSMKNASPHRAVQRVRKSCRRTWFISLNFRLKNLSMLCIVRVMSQEKGVYIKLQRSQCANQIKEWSNRIGGHCCLSIRKQLQAVEKFLFAFLKLQNKTKLVLCFLVLMSIKQKSIYLFFKVQSLLKRLNFSRVLDTMCISREFIILCQFHKMYLFNKH